jgi:diguanylate cyclase (GGDEF)-like protein
LTAHYALEEWFFIGEISLQAQSYFQLLNPLVFLLFSIGFLSLFAVKRDMKAAAWISASYAFGAAAFLIDFLRDSFSLIFVSVVTNVLYTITAVTFSAGLAMRYREHAPWTALLLAAAVNLSAYAFFLFVYDDMWMRAFAVNLGNGLILTIGLFAIRSHMYHAIDKVVFGVYALMCVQFVVRPVIVFLLDDTPFTIETYNDSVFFIAFHLAVGVIAVTMAMTLFVSFSIQIIEDLGERSITDTLSGILNRRGFEEGAARTFSLADETGEAVCLVLADIDHFKSINDNYGHGFGDLVIARTGALFRGYANGGRSAGRIGGEEFVLLMPSTRLEDGRLFAEAIRRKFAAHKFRTDQGALTFSASFGVAERRPGEALTELLSRADEALYYSKENGRDRVSDETDLDKTDPSKALDALERRHRRGHNAPAMAGGRR